MFLARLSDECLCGRCVRYARAETMPNDKHLIATLAIAQRTKAGNNLGGVS
jgi:hypothetical protein